MSVELRVDGTSKAIKFAEGVKMRKQVKKYVPDKTSLKRVTNQWCITEFKNNTQKQYWFSSLKEAEDKLLNLRKEANEPVQNI